MKPPSLSVQSVVQWLVHGARNAPLSQEALTELCERLTAAGLPLWRVTVFVRTLHPEIVGRRFGWHPETGTVVTDGSFELLERRSFRDSPLVHVSNTGESFRRRLADPDCVMDYPSCTTCATKASPIVSWRRYISPAARCISRPGRHGSPAVLPMPRSRPSSRWLRRWHGSPK